MKDIEIVLENLASQEVTPDKAQELFLETFHIKNKMNSQFSYIFKKKIKPERLPITVLQRILTVNI